MSDLLNFNDSSPSESIIQQNINSSPRKSLDNNPFDRVCKQVENFSADPFEFVAAQSKNFKPVISCIRTGNLLGLGDESFDKENNNNEGNISPAKSAEKKISRRSTTDSGKKRDSLLKLSIVNASKSALTHNDVVAENQIGEKWMNMDMPDDSFNDLMKQECVLVDAVDSDMSLNDFESELNIPMLKELASKKDEETSETSKSDEKSPVNETHTSIIDRAIAKLNEIKLAKSRQTNLDDTMTKLKEMVSKVDTNGNGEASQLVEQLCAALNKSGNSNKNTLEPPPVMVRQGTFDIDKEENDESTEMPLAGSDSPQLQSVIDKLSEVLGNVNVIQSPDNPQAANPVVVVVVNNPDVGYGGMSDTVTLAQHHNFNTPQPKMRTRRSQSFSSACRPNTVAPSAMRRESIAVATPQRNNINVTRRSFSFNSPAAAKPVVAKRTSIVPSTTFNQKSALTTMKKPAVPPSTAPNRMSFMDKLKPKIGIQQKKPTTITTRNGPMKVVYNPRDKSPNSSVNSTIKSLSSTLNRSVQPPIAQSTPMSRFATPQKPSRLSIVTPNRPTTAASTLTVPKNPAGTNIRRRSSFNDKEKPVLNAKPKLTVTRPSTGGLLTQRKFPSGVSTASSATGTTRTSTSRAPMTLKMRK
ncbi:uncharacterized protein LOC134834255 [Culicoides brevitarsis]|uniref:uncharacterized protein LOC134834255 n=1 Tax=Culicoides brevitarsis TaxID=469753 RepID=UPI00307C6547